MGILFWITLIILGITLAKGLSDKGISLPVLIEPVSLRLRDALVILAAMLRPVLRFIPEILALIRRCLFKPAIRRELPHDPS